MLSFPHYVPDCWGSSGQLVLSPNWSIGWLTDRAGTFNGDILEGQSQNQRSFTFWIPFFCNNPSLYLQSKSTPKIFSIKGKNGPIINNSCYDHWSIFLIQAVVIGKSEIHKKYVLNVPTQRRMSKIDQKSKFTKLKSSKRWFRLRADPVSEIHREPRETPPNWSKIDRIHSLINTSIPWNLQIQYALTRSQNHTISTWSDRFRSTWTSSIPIHEWVPLLTDHPFITGFVPLSPPPKKCVH